MFSVAARATLFDRNIRNQHQVNQAFGAVRLENADHAAGRRERHEIRMLHANSAAVRKMNDKRPKRVGMAKLSNLFNCHGMNLMDVFVGSKPPEKNPPALRPAGFAKFQFD
jgi:hypothetical protein